MRDGETIELAERRTAVAVAAATVLFCLTSSALSDEGGEWVPITTKEAIEAGLYSAEEERDFFQLFTECGRIGLLVVVEDGEEIGLTKEAVETASRSRLRAARIFSPSPDPMSGLLFVYVNIGDDDMNVFSHRAQFAKFLFDDYTGLRRLSPAGWTYGGLGMHGRDVNFVLSYISRSLDAFIDDYLRVNAGEC